MHKDTKMSSKSLKEILVLFGDGDGGTSGSRNLFEVGGIVRVLDGRFPWDFCITNVSPVELSEPGMLLDILTVIASSKPLSRIRIKKTENNMLGSQRKELWKLNDSFKNFFVDIPGLFVVVEWRIASEQLIDENTNSPIINCFSIA